jgi:hypothetical protein
MSSALNHAYDSARRADLIRQARQSTLAADVAVSRDDERRSFLHRAWRLRFRSAPARTTIATA